MQDDLSGFDYLIIGGGSAGCVMARRLSADPSIRVLLCEAGPDIPPDNIPSIIADAYPGYAARDEAYQWKGLQATYVHGSNNPKPRLYEQARVLGGGSSINGQFFNRGAPADYDAWERLGAKGWNWESVFPHFKRIETDLDFHDQYHGQDGPIHIRRIFPDQWPGHARAVGEGLASLGYDYLPDQNGEFRNGYYPIAISNLDETRESTATTYLDASVRRRPNLRILTDSEVSTLLFQGTRCVGAVVHQKGRKFRAYAEEIILSAGAIGSPAILMRSGVGPGGHLRENGIDVVASVPGVGQHLMEHPACALASFIRKGERINNVTRHHIRVGARYSSGLVGAPQSDMLVVAVTRTAWHRVGARIGTLMTYVNNSYSNSGVVSLTSADWRVRPKVELNMLSDKRDLDRLVIGFRWMAALQATQAMKEATADVFPASYSERVRSSSAVSLKNRISTGILSVLLDGPAPLRSFLMRRVVAAGPTLQELLADEDALRAFLTQTCNGVWHVSSSCRMGSADDHMAVTNELGRVRNVAGLSVVDASILPYIPGCNTNAPTIMVAEKISADILSQR